MPALPFPHYDPWNGRSALDAVEIMNYAANLMREHIEPTARIHYVIPRAGEAPNVVNASYWPNWDIARGIDVTANAVRPGIEVALALRHDETIPMASYVLGALRFMA